MRLLICAGGTGGGVYPALAALQALNAEHSGIETLWVGSEGGMEADLLKREGVEYTEIPAAGLHGVGLRALPGNLGRLARGLAASGRILRQFQPDVLFFTGGYLAGPMAVAARLRTRRIPIMLFVPDIEPGMALKLLGRVADRIAVSAPDSQKYFARKVELTGYPVRASLGKWDRKSGRTALGLRSDLPVLLVAGGSKGARSINQALNNHLETLLQLTQIVHVTGQLDWADIQGRLPRLSPLQRERYKAYPYLHDEMGAALAAADLVVARAGASTLGEFPFFGLPAILAPYPYAWRYQRVNAEYLQSHLAAIVVQDEALDRLLPGVVRDLLGNPSKLEAMQTAMRSLARPAAASSLAAQLVALGGGRA